MMVRYTKCSLQSVIVINKTKLFLILINIFSFPILILTKVGGRVVEQHETDPSIPKATYTLYVGIYTMFFTILFA